MFTIPNLLGFFRLVSAPVVVALILEGQYNYAFWLFVIAGLTDALDGPIARRLKQTNKFGLYLDPAADKILVNSAYMTAAYVGFLPWWIAVLVLARDIGIVFTIGVSHLLKLDIQVKPTDLSKTNTGFQIALIGLALGEPAFGLDLQDIIPILIWFTAFTTAVSWGLYFVSWFKSVLQLRK